MPTITKFPPLFKKSSTGALLRWEVWAEDAAYYTRHGQVDGAIQESCVRVKEGKNLGKKNATTPEEQAALEAEAKWVRKRDRERYVASATRACAGESDAKGGIAPMLAKTYEDIQKKVWRALPAGVDGQRKFDGVRCEAFVDVGEDRSVDVQLWSRKQERFLALPHIVAAYEQLGRTLPPGLHVFDGDLYRHGWKLQKIASYCAVARKEPKPGCEEISHYCYDIPSEDAAWRERREVHREFLKNAPAGIVYVAFRPLPNEEALIAYHREVVERGYEGVIGRDLDGVYQEGKRSSFLWKYKAWKTGEFPIVDVHEGKGKFAGLAMFSCRAPNGATFDCTAPGDFADRAAYFRMGAALVGQPLTIRYFDETEDGVPHFGTGKALELPEGVAIRNYEG